MRSFRSLSVLIVLLGGLLAYLYFVDAKKPVEQAEEKAKVFAGVESDKIDELKVSTVAGGVATLQKAADGWKLTGPLPRKRTSRKSTGSRAICRRSRWSGWLTKRLGTSATTGSRSL